MNRFRDQGCEVFEFGTFARKEAFDAGMDHDEAFGYPGFVSAYWRSRFFELGRGPFRWTCISGSTADRDRLDDLALEMFPECPVTQRWIPLARRHLPVEGLPARVCFMGFGQRKDFALAVNRLVSSGDVEGPIAFSRDNLDAGSIANPAMETETMKDGSDAISDWPFLNALLNTAAMADLVSIQANGTMGVSHHTGVTIVADGTAESAVRIEAAMTTDSASASSAMPSPDTTPPARSRKARVRCLPTPSRSPCGGRRMRHSAPRADDTGRHDAVMVAFVEENRTIATLLITVPGRMKSPSHNV